MSEFQLAGLEGCLQFRGLDQKGVCSSGDWIIVGSHCTFASMQYVHNIMHECIYLQLHTTHYIGNIPM